MLVKLSPTVPWSVLRCDECGRNFNSRFEDARICACCVMRREQKKKAAEKRLRQRKQSPSKQKRAPRQKLPIFKQVQACQHCKKEFSRDKLQPYCSNQCSGLGQSGRRQKHDYEEVKRLHLMGLRGKDIAKQIGCSDSSVNYALKKLGLKL